MTGGESGMCGLRGRCYTRASRANKKGESQTRPLPAIPRPNHTHAYSRVALLVHRRHKAAQDASGLLPRRQLCTCTVNIHLRRACRLKLR